VITILSSKKGVPGNEYTSGAEIKESIHPKYQEENVTDGSEFLDDAIRTKDQLLSETNAKENK
jgi:hypothetical protein